MVSAMDFLDSLKSYDKDSIPAFIVKKIKDSYLTNPDFIPEKVCVSRDFPYSTNEVFFHF